MLCDISRWSRVINTASLQKRMMKEGRLHPLCDRHELHCTLQVRDVPPQTLETDRRSSGMSTRTGDGSRGGGRSFAHDAEGGSPGGSGISAAAPQASLSPTCSAATAPRVPTPTVQRGQCKCPAGCSGASSSTWPRHGRFLLQEHAAHDRFLPRMQASEQGVMPPGELGHQDVRLQGDRGVRSRQDPVMPFLSGPPAALDWSSLYRIPLEVRHLLATHAHLHVHPEQFAIGVFSRSAALSQPYVWSLSTEHSNITAQSIPICLVPAPLHRCLDALMAKTPLCDAGRRHRRPLPMDERRLDLGQPSQEVGNLQSDTSGAGAAHYTALI